ncbi:DUF6531 domain-containing protein [Candidatus Gracilibacteria bacterium]|nr:DUF6531 domain-containing protein [Candidatus Gracilibacteria bacterium]
MKVFFGMNIVKFFMLLAMFFCGFGSVGAGSEELSSTQIFAEKGENFIYYTPYSKQGLYRMDFDGENKQQIYPEYINSFIVYGDVVYFYTQEDPSNYDSYQLYSIQSDGTNLELLGNVGYIQFEGVQNNFLYYSEFVETIDPNDPFSPPVFSNVLWKRNITNGEKLEISSNFRYMVGENTSSLYFLEQNTLKVFKRDSQEVSTVLDDVSKASLKIYDDFIVVSYGGLANKDDPRMDIYNSQTHDLIESYSLENLNNTYFVSDNYIFYRDQYAPLTYRVNRENNQIDTISSPDNFYEYYTIEENPEYIYMRGGNTRDIYAFHTQDLTFLEIPRNHDIGTFRFDDGRYLYTSSNDSFYRIDLNIGIGALINSMLEITASDACENSEYHTAYLNLYKTDGNEEKFSFYNDSQTYRDSTIGCMSGGWLHGSKRTTHSCEFIDLNVYEQTTDINYTCSLYEKRGSSAAGGSGWEKTTYKDGTFTIQNNLCLYDESFCLPSFPGYENPEENNDSDYTSDNTPSGETILEEKESEQKIEASETASQQDITNTSDAGDPVMLHSGEFVYDNTLMAYSSLGMPFELNIHYENQAYYNGPIGNNFDHNYNLFLVEDSEGNMNFHNGKLGVFPFVKTQEGFAENVSIDAKLEQINDTYHLSMDQKMTYIFGENLRIESMTDNFGNTFSFLHDENNQLTQITDSLGRVYGFTYYDHSRLQTITDFLGNTLDFEYYGSGATDGSEYDLQKIITTNSGESKEISFTYTIGDDFESSHNIVDLIDSAGNIYVTNTYDANDRVIDQQFGEGSISYEYTLSGSGNVLENRVVDRVGDETIYSYNDRGNTTKKVVKKETGDSVYSYEYDEKGQLIAEVYPLGNGYSYLYDERENMTEKRMKADMTAPDSADDLVWIYEYHPDYNTPIQTTQPNGLVILNTLDEQGNMIQTQMQGVEDAEGNPLEIIEKFSYNPQGQLISRTDANENITQFEYDGQNLVKTIEISSEGNRETLFTYDDAGNIISSTDANGNTTQMTYDAFFLLTSQTTPTGIVSEYAYNDLNKKIQQRLILQDGSDVTTLFEYDILDNLTETTTEKDEGETESIATKYDADSRIIETQSRTGAKNTFEYSPSGKILKKTTHSNKGNISTIYSYDLNDRLISQTAPNGSVTTFAYDGFDRLMTQTDALGTVSVFDYDPSGNIIETTVTNSDGVMMQKMTRDYDLLDRAIVDRSHNLETGEILETTTRFDPAGNIIRVTDPSGNTTRFVYDDFHQQIESIDALGNRTLTDYDPVGNILSTTLFGTDSQEVKTQYLYDPDNRLIQETNTLGEVKQYSYNNLGQLISRTDKDEGITEYSYDYSGNILTETHEGRTISYEYDANNNMSQLTDANGNVTQYTYNDINELITITYPDGNKTEYEYDVSGNMISKIDPNGTRVEYEYDVLNRLIQKDIQTGSGVLGVTSETYRYDALGRLLDANDSSQNNLTFSYDSLSRLQSESNGGQEIDYSYDRVGNRIGYDAPGIAPIVYEYDPLNRLSHISVSPHPNPLPEGEGRSPIVDYTYNSLQKTLQTLGNGVKTEYSYDPLLRLKTLNNFVYEYNTQGNIISNGSDNYNYDSLDRISSVDYGQKHNKWTGGTFEYDLMGNRTSEVLSRVNKKGKTRNVSFHYTVNDLNQYSNREVYKNIPEPEQPSPPAPLPSSGTEVPEGEGSSQEIGEDEEITIEMEGKLLYDAAGNLIGNMLNNRRQYVYSYDYKNRLVQIEKHIYKKDQLEKTVKVVEITYDVLGRRSQKKFNNGSYRNYIYSNQDVILEQNYSKKDKLKNQRQIITSNQTDDILAMILSEFKTRKVKEPYTETSTYYYQKDHLGSIIAITDESANIVEEYVYDVFGKPYSKHADGSITNLKKSKIGNTRLYTGREYDRGLKLYYNRARYYDPKLARFISRDPIDIADDVNLYAYVKNNPVNFTDIFGLAAKPVIPEKPPTTAAEHYARNKLNIGLPETQQEAYDMKWIYLNQSKSIYHSFGTPTFEFNKKYISPDGHREVVFDYKTGERDNSPENMGTYNYYSPITHPKLHKEYDVDPYFEWGNTAEDSTSVIERYSKTTKYIPAKINQSNDEINRKVNNFNEVDFVNTLIYYFK